MAINIRQIPINKHEINQSLSAAKLHPKIANKPMVLKTAPLPLPVQNTHTPPIKNSQTNPIVSPPG